MLETAPGTAAQIAATSEAGPEMLVDIRENADKAEAPGVICTDVPCMMIPKTKSK